MARSISIKTEYEYGGRQNILPAEVKTQLVEDYSSYPKEAEKANGRRAMIFFIALIGAYTTMEQIIPGIF